LALDRLELRDRLVKLSVRYALRLVIAGFFGSVGVSFMWTWVQGVNSLMNFMNGLGSMSLIVVVGLV